MKVVVIFICWTTVRRTNVIPFTSPIFIIQIFFSNLPSYAFQMLNIILASIKLDIYNINTLLFYFYFSNWLIFFYFLSNSQYKYAVQKNKVGASSANPWIMGAMYVIIPKIRLLFLRAFTLNSKYDTPKKTSKCQNSRTQKTEKSNCWMENFLFIYSNLTSFKSYFNSSNCCKKMIKG